MFHHGYLAVNEYHFTDVSDVKLSISSNDMRDPRVRALCCTDETADVHFTSHGIYAEIRRPRTMKESELFASVDGDKEIDVPVMARFDFSKMSILKGESPQDLKFSVEIVEEFIGYFEHSSVRSGYQISVNGVDEKTQELLKKNIKIRSKWSTKKRYTEKLNRLIEEHERSMILDMLNSSRFGYRILHSTTVFDVSLYFRSRSLLLITTGGVFVNSLASRKSLFIAMRDITRVMKKPWRTYECALEIYFNNKSVLVAFDDLNQRNNSYDIVSKTPSIDNLTINDYQKMWVNHTLSNCDYLEVLNDFAGRTRHDLCQYPVFPWIVQQYEYTDLDLLKGTTYRDLSKSTKIITPEKVKATLEKRKGQNQSDNRHYSDPVDVLRYLQRKYPYLVLSNSRLSKNGLISIGDEWKAVSSNSSCLNELSPEFFSSDTSFLSRKPGIPPVKLPNWANTKQEFLYRMRNALENKIHDKSFSLWIDIVFGVGQGDEKNGFGSSLYVEAPAATKFPNGMETVAINPKQIFNEKHMERLPSADTVFMEMMKRQHISNMEYLKSKQTDEYSKLRKENAELKNIVQGTMIEDTRVEQLKQFQTRIDDLINELEHRKKEVQERDSKIDSLSRSLIAQQLENQKKDTLFSHQASSLGKLRDHIRVLEQELSNTNEELDKERDNFKVHLGQSQDHFNKEQTLRNKVEELRAKLERETQNCLSKNKELEKAKEHIDTLKKKLTKPNVVSRSTISTRTKLQYETALEEANLVNRALGAKLSESRNDIRMLEKSMTDLETNLKFQLQENRQLKINVHFLEQKCKENFEIKEGSTGTLLSDPTKNLPNSILYHTKKKGEAERIFRSRDDQMVERTPAFTRNPLSPRQSRTVSALVSPRQMKLDRK